MSCCSRRLQEWLQLARAPPPSQVGPTSATPLLSCGRGIVCYTSAAAVVLSGKAFMPYLFAPDKMPLVGRMQVASAPPSLQLGALEVHKACTITFVSFVFGSAPTPGTIHILQVSHDLA